VPYKYTIGGGASVGPEIKPIVIPKEFTMYDSLSPNEADLLRTVKAQIAERRRLREEEQYRARAYSARAQKVVASFHEKLFDQAAKNIGVDIDAISERQQAERASAMDFLATEKRRAVELSSETKKYQQIQQLERSERFQRRLAQPASSNFVGVYLTSATDIQLTGKVGSSSIAPQENLAHTRVEVLGWVSGLQWDQRADLAIVDWHFLWTPPQDGVINLISLVAMNGWGFTYPGPGCVKGNSYYTIDAELGVTQVGAGGTPITDSVRENVTSDSFDSSDFPSGGGVILQPRKLDYPTAISYGNQFMAIGQTPLMITMSVTLWALVSHGEAEVNFLDGDFYLNVPTVFVGLS
jgi:hypothetical protein